jgi:hypothetical protein
MLAHKPIQQITDEGAESIGLYWLNKKTKKAIGRYFMLEEAQGIPVFLFFVPKPKQALSALPVTPVLILSIL